MVVATAVLVGMPLAIRVRPASASDLTAGQLAERVRGSRGVAWSGLVQSFGGLQVPDNASFASLAQLLGEDNQLRAWWRAPDDWRVDRIRSTGETDLFRQRGYLTRWVFESETAVVSPVSKIHLPDASDLLPPTLARSMLRGARTDELARLPAARLAGVDAPGLRITPDDPATTVGHVDLWADPETGLPLRVELFGVGDRRPVLTTAVVELDRRPPAAATTNFIPPERVDLSYEDSVDVAAAANAAAPDDLPSSLAGLASRAGEDPGAVGIYGRGPTTLIVLPLRGQVAGPLRRQLQLSATARETDVGTLAPVGPIGLLVTLGRGRGGFLLAGTVNALTLQRAATELLGRR